MSVDDTPADVRDDFRPESEPPEERQVTCAVPPEAERLACKDELGSDRAQIRVGELLRRQLGQGGRELDHERLGHPEAGQQLEAPLERGEQLHAVSEHLPRVWVEGETVGVRPDSTAVRTTAW